MTLSLWADEIEDGLTAALQAHKAGKVDDTVKAVQEVQKLLAAKAVLGLKDALPDMIGDWKGGKLEQQSLEGAGGGMSLRRSYKRGDKEKGNEQRASVVMSVDSPLMEKIGGALAKPQIAALLGMKSVPVGEHTAVYMEKQGLVQWVVKGRFLIAVEGKKLKQAELLQVAAGIKTDLLK
jgi:hypothetical protein